MSEPNALSELDEQIPLPPFGPISYEEELEGKVREKQLGKGCGALFFCMLQKREAQLTEALSKLSVFENLAAMEIPERLRWDERKGGNYAADHIGVLEADIDVLLAKLAVAEREIGSLKQGHGAVVNLHQEALQRANAAELAIKTAYYYLNSISQGLFGGVPAAKEVLREALEGKGAR